MDVTTKEMLNQVICKIIRIKHMKKDKFTINGTQNTLSQQKTTTKILIILSKFTANENNAMLKKIA